MKLPVYHNVYLAFGIFWAYWKNIPQDVFPYMYDNHIPIFLSYWISEVLYICLPLLLYIYSLTSLVPYALSAKILLPCILSCDNISTAFLLSWTWPAVKPIYRGLPSPSTTACILVVLPPEFFPICCPTSESFAPFLLLHCSDEPLLS